MVLRAVCVVANPRNSMAIAAVLRLASHPAKPLSRREEIVNAFLGRIMTKKAPGVPQERGIFDAYLLCAPAAPVLDGRVSGR